VGVGGRSRRADGRRERWGRLVKSGRQADVFGAIAEFSELSAKPVELAVPYSAEEGMPLVWRESQYQAGCVLAVADTDVAAWEVPHLDTVAVGET
jgi:hypothetical protein